MIEQLIIVRGGGDIASGTIHRLHRCGFKVVVLEVPCPTAIRRPVSFAEAVHEGRQTVEGVTAVRAAAPVDCPAILASGRVPVLVDPQAQAVAQLQPLAVIDAILAKRNTTTHRAMAPITIGLGPGFTAGQEVDAVIETMRGHDLGRVICQGSARPDTGIPETVAGHGRERVIYATGDGIITIRHAIGSRVTRGELLAMLGPNPVLAPIDGLIRGLIHPRCPVRRGQKIGDIDPRPPGKTDHRTISDKARCIGGGVLEALFTFL